MSGQPAGLKKAKLRVDGGKEELTFLYNPSEYTVSKSATWNRPQTRGAKTTAKPEFGGTNPQSIQLEIFFDDWKAATDREAQKPSQVADKVAQLLTWTRPTSDSVSKGLPNPPVLVFEWGANPALAGFRGYLKSVTAKYTLFDKGGKPRRATANITLEEVPTEPKPGNPSSGGRSGYRSHILREGETLHSLAYQEYGQPALWRALALYNDIDDPLRIPAGSSLLLPEMHEAMRLVD